MSEIAQLTHKAVSMSAAIATLGTDPEWDRRVTEYLRCDALQSAFAGFGGLFQAAEDCTLKRWEAERLFGHGWQQTAEGRAFMADAHKKVNQAEELHAETYLRPFWNAAKALVMTPAPNVQAAAYKALVIEADEIWNSHDMPDDCLQIVADDFARVTGGA
jgi:hypothetical protein